jgi:hypothetical protein
MGKIVQVGAELKFLTSWSWSRRWSRKKIDRLRNTAILYIFFETKRLITVPELIFAIHFPWDPLPEMLEKFAKRAYTVSLGQPHKFLLGGAVDLFLFIK